MHSLNPPPLPESRRALRPPLRPDLAPLTLRASPLFLGCLAGLLAAVLACSGAPKPVTPAPPMAEAAAPAQPGAQATGSPAGAASPAATGPQDGQTGPEKSSSPKGSEAKQPPSDEADGSKNTIMIDRGTGGGKPSLFELSVAEGKRRAKAQEPIARVTNENLHEYQDAQLTFAKAEDEGKASDAAQGKDGEKSEAAAATEQHGEEYWSSRVLGLRTKLRDAVDEIDDLQDRIADLRRRFYSEDDPYVRDGQIKPAWDRALDRLTRTHDDVARLRKELADTLEEGRRDGALPGWLREGIELEPTFKDEEQPASRDGGLPIYEPEEPKTVEPDEPPSSTSSNADEPPP